MVCVVPAGLEILLSHLENAYVSFLSTACSPAHRNNCTCYAVARFRFSLTTFSVDENNGPLVGSITLDTAGQLDRAISVVVQTNPTGSAIRTYMCMHAL